MTDERHRPQDGPARRPRRAEFEEDRQAAARLLGRLLAAAWLRRRPPRAGRKEADLGPPAVAAMLDRPEPSS